MMNYCIFVYMGKLLILANYIFLIFGTDIYERRKHVHVTYNHRGFKSYKKMSLTIVKTEIKNIQFVGSSAMLLALSNDRTFIVPLDKFQEIANLSVEDRENFEVIDGEHLSFLAIDEIYSLQELIGI